MATTSAEATDENEALRLVVVEMLDDVTVSAEHRLKAAVKAGELPKRTKTGRTSPAAYHVLIPRGDSDIQGGSPHVAPIERFQTHPGLRPIVSSDQPAHLASAAQGDLQKFVGRFCSVSNPLPSMLLAPSSEIVPCR